MRGVAHTLVSLVYFISIAIVVVLLASWNVLKIWCHMFGTFVTDQQRFNIWSNNTQAPGTSCKKLGTAVDWESTLYKNKNLTMPTLIEPTNIVSYSFVEHSIESVVTDCLIFLGSMYGMMRAMSLSEDIRKVDRAHKDEKEARLRGQEETMKLRKDLLETEQKAKRMEDAVNIVNITLEDNGMDGTNDEENPVAKQKNAMLRRAIKKMKEK